MQIIIDTIKNILPSQCAKSKINFKEIRTSSTMLLPRVNITRIFIDILEKYQVGIVLKKKKKGRKENSRVKFDFYATETNYAENREGGGGSTLISGLGVSWFSNFLDK